MVARRCVLESSGGGGGSHLIIRTLNMYTHTHTQIKKPSHVFYSGYFLFVSPPPPLLHYVPLLTLIQIIYIHGERARAEMKRGPAADAFYYPYLSLSITRLSGASNNKRTHSRRGLHSRSGGYDASFCASVPFVAPSVECFLHVIAQTSACYLLSIYYLYTMPNYGYIFVDRLWIICTRGSGLCTACIPLLPSSHFMLGSVERFWLIFSRKLSLILIGDWRFW
jgi:hypothetical protein